MSSAAQDLETLQRPDESGENPAIQINRIQQFRTELQLVADRAYQAKFINEDAYFGLHQVARGETDVKMDDATLQKALDFQRKDYARAEELISRLNESITHAIRDGISSERDREFLMQHLILTGGHNLTEQAQKLEAKLREKFDRMREDRNAYDELKNHPLAANTGFLKTDADTKILIPNEKVFLNLTVPERRAFLQRAKEALPKAQAYAEKAGEAESKGLTLRYDKLLDEAWHKKRIIGAKTVAKFQDGFKKIDRKDKEEWLREFEAQMKRYEDLWGKIRENLKGPALERMEGMRDQKGYTELFTEYGRAIETESKTLCGKYDQKLQTFHDQRVISLHTKNAFSQDIRKQDFEGQNKYADLLDQEMGKYKTLRAQIDALKAKNPKAWKEVDELYDSPDHGHKEIRARFMALTSSVSQTPEQDFQSKMRKLEGVRRERVRKNVIQSEEHLESRGQKEKMIYRLDQLVRHGQQDRYDQSSYSGNIQQLRGERKKGSENQEVRSGESGVGSREPDPMQEVSSIASLRARHRGLEARSEDGVHSASKANDRFHVTEVRAGDQTKKAIQFEIGNQDATRVFLHDENIRTEGRDQVTFLARDGAEADRMTFEEIRRYRDYLKSTLPKAA